MAYFKNHPSRPPERIERIEDPQSGLDGVVVIHSTRLGPAAGGCRLWKYSSEAEMVSDAVRLAEGMSYKNALAGLPLGGGKAVLRMPPGEFDRAQVFRAFGRAVERLGGEYVTAEDVGTSVGDMEEVAKCTAYVSGLPTRSGHPGGDPSPWTALGVFGAMEVAAERRYGKPLAALRVAVQGLGSVGADLCRLLHDSGAQLVVTDIDRSKAIRVAGLYKAQTVEPEDIVSADVDVFAPCAMGKAIDQQTATRLRAGVVCGAANNQLASEAEGEVLARRGVLYAPDFVVNAGGIVSVAGEYLGWSKSEVQVRVDAIPARLLDLFNAADAAGIRSECLAVDQARDAISATKGPSPLRVAA